MTKLFAMLLAAAFAFATVTPVFAADKGDESKMEAKDDGAKKDMKKKDKKKKAEKKAETKAEDK